MEEIKKRPNPFEKKIDEMSKQVEEPKTAKKETTSKSTTTKKASTTTKKPAVKKPTTKTKTVIDPKTGTAKVVKAKETTSKASTTTKKTGYPTLTEIAGDYGINIKEDRYDNGSTSITESLDASGIETISVSGGKIKYLSYTMNYDELLLKSCLTIHTSFSFLVMTMVSLNDNR